MTTAEISPQTPQAGRIGLHAHFYLAGVLLVIASIGFNYWFERVNRLKNAGLSVPLKQPLSTIPKELGNWVQIREEKLSDETKYVAGVDDYINRWYAEKGKEPTGKDSGNGGKKEKDEGLHVYAAYWGGIRTAAPHNPTICLRGSGWSIASAHRRELELTGMGGGETVGVHVEVYNKDYDNLMIVWWEYIHGKNVTNPLMERLRWVLPVFMGGKAGSVVQVQISKDIGAGEGEEAVYQKIVEFARELAPEVGKCLPEAK